MKEQQEEGNLENRNLSKYLQHSSLPSPLTLSLHAGVLEHQDMLGGSI